MDFLRNPFGGKKSQTSNSSPSSKRAEVKMSPIEKQQIDQLKSMLQEMGMNNSYSANQLYYSIKINPGDNQKAMDSLMSGEVDEYIVKLENQQQLSRSGGKGMSP